MAGESSNWTPLAPHSAFSANTWRKQSSGELESQPVGHSELSVDWEPRPPAISVQNPESPEFSLRPTDVPQEPACYLGGVIGLLKTQCLDHGFLWPPGGRVCQACGLKEQGEGGFSTSSARSVLSHSQEDQPALHISLVSEDWTTLRASHLGHQPFVLDILALLLRVSPMNYILPDPSRLY